MASTPLNEQRSSRYPDLLLLSISVVLAYGWLQVGWLRPYSLQGFAIGILVFFAIKSLARFQVGWRERLVKLELPPFLFALILVLGSGATGQALFPLVYVFLLLMTLATDLVTTVIVTAQLVLALFALSEQLGPSAWQQLLSIPLMVAFFLYVKQQVVINANQRLQLAASSSALSSVAAKKLTLERFVAAFLKPKLAALAELANNQQTTKQLLLSQLELLQSEIDKVLARQAVEEPATEEPEVGDESAPPDSDV